MQFNDIWLGRIDPQANTKRMHQHVQLYRDKVDKGAVLVGFAVDEGVKRNLGRVGAQDAPLHIRKALANLAVHVESPLYDAGDIYCVDDDLETAQQRLANQLADILQAGHFPIVLGGGHEVAFGTWLGLYQHLNIAINGFSGGEEDFFKPEVAEPQNIGNIGIINFDAHFDLRNPDNGNSSGTPFAQIAAFSNHEGINFNYAVLGISESSNTKALFAKARQLNAWIIEDWQLNHHTLPQISTDLCNWLRDKDYIYLSIDIDVLPSYQAPGCSAPAALGVDLAVLLALIKIIKQSGKLKIADIAEVNPRFDIDNRTAKTAARIVYALIS